MILRRQVGMELEQYIRKTIAAPLQFGGWGYSMQQANGKKLEYTPGAGGIALRATDALRFSYLLLRNGRWHNQQVVPAEYLDLCRRPSAFNPHSPFSLQCEVNQDRHVAGAPPDAKFSSNRGREDFVFTPFPRWIWRSTRCPASVCRTLRNMIWGLQGRRTSRMVHAMTGSRIPPINSMMVR